MLALVLKFIHILGAVLFLGAGTMTAYYKLRANKSDDMKIKLWYHKEMVLADWLFTAPSAFILPITGLWLAYLYNLPLTTKWILLPLAGYTITGILWLPAVYLQIKMHKLVKQAYENQTALPESYTKANRLWLALGAPAFSLSLYIVWIMVSKPL